jgi:hypothetical protein
MQSNFKILSHLNSSYLHLKLVGDFDRTSAKELIDTLRQYCRKVSTIIIHTDCVKQIIPFDPQDFRLEFERIKSEPVQFIFTGEHAALLD